MCYILGMVGTRTATKVLRQRGWHCQKGVWEYEKAIQFVINRALLLLSPPLPSFPCESPVTAGIQEERISAETWEELRSILVLDKVTALGGPSKSLSG